MVAEEAYEELRVRAKGGFALKTVTVDAFFEGWIPPMVSPRSSSETSNTARGAYSSRWNPAGQAMCIDNAN